MYVRLWTSSTIMKTSLSQFLQKASSTSKKPLDAFIPAPTLSIRSAFTTTLTSTRALYVVMHYFSLGSFGFSCGTDTQSH